MTEKTNGVKNPITLRRAFATAAVLLVFALVFVAPAAAEDVSVSTQDELNNAITNAAGATTITLESGTYKLFDVSALNKDITFAGTSETVIDMTAIQTNMLETEDSSFKFSGVTVNFKSTQSNPYHGMPYTENLVYENCKITGVHTLCAGSATYTGCEFENYDDYCVYTYGATDIVFTDCHFKTGGKAVLLYTEGEIHATAEFNNCVFNSDSSLTGEKAAIEVGSSPYSADTTYTIIINNCTEEGFASNNSPSSLFGNKNSLDYKHLIGIIDGVEVTAPFTYVLGTVSDSIYDSEQLVIPINLLNKAGEMVPNVWYLDVTVTNSDTLDVVSCNIGLTVQAEYANGNVEHGDFTVDGGEYKFHVTGKGNANQDVDGLFTITISGLPASETPYDVDIEILSGIYDEDKVDYEEYSAIRSKAVTIQSVKTRVIVLDNFYNDAVDSEKTIKKWSLDEKAWAKITVENNLAAGQDSFTTTQKDTLVERGGFPLSLNKSGTYTISIVDQNENIVEPKGTIKLTEENGYIVLYVENAEDKAAKQFIIEFTGRKVGDVANLPSVPDAVDVADAYAILSSWVAVEGSGEKNTFASKPEYAVYADINMDGNIDAEDATAAYLKGVNKLSADKEKNFLLTLTP